MATESIRNVKLLCSFGGRILPRPSDSKLRYAGGETHIVTIRRSATISDFFAKISQIFDGTIVAVKYQLPDEDLDTLISISCQEDFDNMLDEFDSISDVSVDGSAKIRIFLFDDSESDVLGFSSEMIDNGQVYCKAINDGSIKAKKGSSFSNASSDIQNDASSAKSELGFCVDENLGKVGNSGSKGIVSAVSGELYNNFGTKLECIDMNSHNNGAGDSNIVHDISSRINNVICHQPLNLLTQLHPAQILPCDAFYVPTQRCSQQQAVILDNCGMFEKPLLHAYSGRFKNEQLNVNVSGHGNNRDGSLLHDQGSMLMSYQFIDPRSVQASVRPNIVNERVAINSNVQSLDLIQEFHTPVVGNTAIVQVQEFHGDFKNGNIAMREPWVLMNGSKPQSQVQLSTGTLETIECAQTLHASNDINATRPLAEDRVNGGNMEILEHPPALHAPITRVDSESVETFNPPQTSNVPIAVDTSKQQASFELSHALHPPTTGTHSQIQINKGTTVALEHLQSLQVPSAMNTSRPQAPVQVNNANVETQKYAQASQAPVIFNSNVETLEKSQEWHVPHVGNTIKAPNQEFHFQSNCQNMPKSEPPFVNTGNLERIEHDRTLHASNVVNVTMPLANVQVNNGTTVTLEQPQVFHAQAARNMMSRTQDQIQINYGTQETMEQSQTPHVPSAMITSTLHGHVNISNGSVETNSQVLPSKPSRLPTVDTVRPQATIQVNSRIREPLELHAPMAMNANRPQAQIQPNIGTLELLDHVQASQVPIALNVTRPQTPIKVNSRIFENKEYSQALRAPESMNTSRLQAHAQTQINTDAVAKNESKIEEVQTGIPCGTCGHTREITHMREKESWPQMNVSSTKESAGETNAGNMAAKTQFATLTDGSAPEMAQSEDDGLLKNPSATTMVHSHFPDPFQTLSQNMDASLDHMLNQDVATKLVNDGSFLVTESPSRVSVPEFSSAYVRPANVSNNVRTTENRNVTELLAAISLANSKVVPILKPDDFISVRENSHGTSQARPISHLLPYPLDSKLEYTTTDLDGNQVLISQAGGSSLHVGNGNSYIVSDGIPCRQIKHMQPPEDFEPLNPLPTSDTNHGSTMMNNRESLISFSENMSTQPEVTYASSFAPDYLTSNAIPVQVSATVPIQYTNAIHIPLVDNNPIQCVSSNSMNGHSVHPNELAPSLFCNLGPQKNPSDVHLVPPVPITISSTELVPPLDLCADHVTSEKGIDAVPMFVEEGGDQHVHNSAIPVQFIQGEGKDVHALTKHVTATALEPSRPLSFTDIPHDMNVLDLSFNKENVLCDANSPTEKAKVEVGDQKFEGTSKQVDMTKVGFLPTNDLGRLQIIKNDDLEELKELGSGSYGTVYHGKWKGSDVAIKRINERCFAGKPSEEERMKSDFWNEACNLAGLHHPNIVAFYGVVLDGPNGSFATVTEFMVNGSLRRALLKNEKILDIRKRLLIAMDVAFGMEYLHSKNMIHFDLKSDNLLVNLRDPQRPICKIADLGLSKVKRQTLISGGMRGTLPWMAPELLNGNSSLVSNKVDVFSFGIVMWELITGQEPYHDLHQGTIIGGIVSNTLRPPVPESCDPDWRSLMEQCWSQEPSDRPTFVEIASRLRSMAASLPQK